MTVMVISFGIVLFLLRFVNILSFMILWSWISPLVLGCLLWHGRLPLLSGVNRGSPWAENSAEGVGNLLECALRACTSGLPFDCRRDLMLEVLLGVCQMNLMSGLMGAWFRIRSLVLRHRDGFLLVFLVNFGLIVGGATWM